MMPSHTCDKCQRPLLEINFYGERLKGCIKCNVWIDTDGAWRNIPEEDIEALNGMRRATN
jgi:hypothetical protein